MSKRPTHPAGAPPPPGHGWRALREEREREFRVDFAPLRRAIQRNELLSATVELFLGAVVGVTKINLGVEAPVGDGPARDGPAGRRVGERATGTPPGDEAPGPTSEGDTSPV